MTTLLLITVFLFIWSILGGIAFAILAKLEPDSQFPEWAYWLAIALGGPGVWTFVFVLHRMFNS